MQKRWMFPSHVRQKGGTGLLKCPHECNASSLSLSRRPHDETIEKDSSHVFWKTEKEPGEE